MIISSGYEMEADEQQDVCLLPSSFAQQRLWFLDQLEPHSTAYNMAASLRLNFALAIEVLHQSLNILLERHEVLRTTFTDVDGQPMQKVAAHVRLAMPLVDISYLAEDEREHEAIRLANQQADQPFDLEQGPLLRCMLLKLGKEEYILLLTVHHIIFDEWSMHIFFHELATLYQSLTTATSWALPELPLQYADFAIWQQEMQLQGVLADHLAYWEEHLAGLPTSINLPVDHPRGEVFSSQGAVHTLTLPPTLVARLKALSQEQNVTFYMTLVAAFQTLMYRYTNQEDVVIGTVTAGRTLSETEPLIGFFANTLVLRADLSGEPSFRQLLARIREIVLDAQAHQDVPFDVLVKELQPERNAGLNPLFQVFLALDPPAPSLPHGWGLDTIPYATKAAKFDLLLGLSEQASGMVCHFEYATHLFDQATIARMAGHWQTLLEGIVNDPSLSIAHLPLLTEGERRQLLSEWNETDRPYPQAVCVHRLIEAQVERTPDAPAVLFEEQQLSYRELNTFANQLAHMLRKRGVGPDVPVGVCMERSLDIVIALLAILKAGGTYVPLDPGYPGERLAFILQDCSMPLLLAQHHLLSRLPSQDIQVFCVDNDSDDIAQESPENPVSEVNAENLAYIIYTSGSTGRPKGVMMPHRAICNHLFCFQEEFHLTPADRILQKTAICFDPSFNEFFSPLLVGAQIVLAHPDGQRDSAYLVQTIIKHGITLLQVVPTLLQMLLMEPDFGRCTSLRVLICGADVLFAEDAERFLSLLPAHLYNLYGPTEACIDTTIWQCERGSTAISVPIGRPEANAQIYILDQHMQPVPIGVPGELYIGGAGLARGYMNKPELTAERFISNPFSNFNNELTEDRDYACHRPARWLYKTGDLVRYRADGAIEFIGRVDQQVKIRGFRVELGEIEAVLRQHSAVQDALVILREDIPGDKRLIAYVVPNKERVGEWQASPLSSPADMTCGQQREGRDDACHRPYPHGAELQVYLAQHLPTYMLPTTIISLDKLPLMPNGKVDRKALPTPQQIGPTREADTAFIAPETIAQYQLVMIWEELLEARPIGMRDNFFHLGGHSLLAARLIQRIHQVFRKKLSLATLFTHPTIEQLALALEAQEEPRTQPRVPLLAVQTKGKKPPFFYLHGDRTLGSFYCFTLARSLGADQPFYALGPYGFDDRHLPGSVEEMAEAHIEVMRSVQPEGPYFIGGWCIGALMAYEVARQLHKAGQAVDLLVLMDAGSVSTTAKVAVRICRTIGTLLHLSTQKQLNCFLFLRHLYNFWHFADYRKQYHYSLLPPAKKLHENWGDITDWIATDYVRRPYSGKITFFWAQDELPNLEAAWREDAHAEGVENVIIPGDHTTSRTVHIHDLATQLAYCMKRVNR